MSGSYRKTLISFTATALIPVILLGSIFAYIIYSSITQEIKKNNGNLLTQIRESNEILLGELDGLSLTLATNHELTSLLHKATTSGVLDYGQSRTYRTMRAFLSSQTVSRRYIHSLYVAFEDCGYRLFSSKDGIVDISTFHDGDWLAALPQKMEKTPFLELRSIPFSKGTNRLSDVISIYQGFSFGTPEEKGVVVLNIDKSYMENMVKKLSTQGGSLFLATVDDAVLFSSNSAAASGWTDALHSLGEEPREFFEYSLDGERYIVSKAFASRYGLCYYLMTPAKKLYELPYTILKTVALCSALLLICSLITIFILSRKQYHRLNSIVAMLQQESPQTDLRQKNYDEYEYIARKIHDNYMLQQYFKMELSEKTYRQKYMELTALQAQINPHMLYNTLEIIQWKSYSLTDSYNEVVTMLEALSSLLKYSLNPATETVSLGEEIDNTVNYTRLLKLRYPDRFEIIWQYPEEILQTETMRLMLQPIIENAISHGANTNRLLKIRIKIVCREGYIYVRVLNTGIGMTKSQLDQVRTKLTSEYAPAKGMGLYNINKRLQLQYGTSLTLHSDVRIGTVAAFRFPATPLGSRAEDVSAGNGVQRPPV